MPEHAASHAASDPRWWRRIANLTLMASLLAAALLPPRLAFGTGDPDPPAQRCHNTTDKTVLWGDLHVHTAYSLDAYLFGVRRSPADAYRFARGAPEVLADGSEIGLERPLDFAAVTDHAEYLAATALCGAGHGGPDCAALDAASEAGDMTVFGRLFAAPLSLGNAICPADPDACTAARLDAWQRIRRAAEEANDPCRFTAFVGSEWSATPDALHWHRNVIFASDAVPAVPPNVIDQPTQEDLWRALDEGCLAQAGCQAVAIPHNSNIGMGGTFRVDRGDTASLRLRNRFERLAEVFQHKGQSECFPGSPLADEACDFEIMLPIPVMRRQVEQPGPLSTSETARIASGYLRDALGEGLVLGARTGVNPFRYGLIASTDTHGARPGYVEEASWAGTFGDYDDTAQERQATRHYNPGGLVAVWARENTRASIFRALERREAYATSGPRILVRFQQTFDAAAELCRGAAPGAATMGGTLFPEKGQPRFAVQAMMDRQPLARIDIIKLAYRNGKVVQHIETVEDPGRREWCVEWRDPDYRRDEPALWYARVLETASRRWSATATDDQWIQERAWSSPIWSTPESSKQDD